jgi:hypothetical protein
LIFYFLDKKLFLLIKKPLILKSLIFLLKMNYLIIKKKSPFLMKSMIPIIINSNIFLYLLLKTTHLFYLQQKIKSIKFKPLIKWLNNLVTLGLSLSLSFFYSFLSLLSILLINIEKNLLKEILKNLINRYEKIF